jgi:hypothetical protein
MPNEIDVVAPYPYELWQLVHEALELTEVVALVHHRQTRR